MTLYRTLTGIAIPKPGKVPPVGVRCAPEDEARYAAGADVDLGHLRPETLGWLLAVGAVADAPEKKGEPAPAGVVEVPEEQPAEKSGAARRVGRS